MPPLGAHQSIAGGFYRAVERAKACGCDCVQLFTGSPRSFGGSPQKLQPSKLSATRKNPHLEKSIALSDAERFRATLAELNVTHPLAHDSYLINLASPRPLLRHKSIDAFIEELRRADLLGIPYVVTHPGSYTTASEAIGLKTIAQAFNEIHAQTRDLKTQCLLETTAGQGTALGCRFEHLAAILDGVKEPERLGFCFDTCHVFAAGYGLGTEPEYRATMAAFDRLLGLHRIKAFHLNDSCREQGSRIDRHTHIGHGKLGIEAFRLLLADRHFCEIPMYLETPKGKDDSGSDWDMVNLNTLRQLTKKVSGTISGGRR